MNKEPKTYGYVRVSTLTQKIDRQMNELYNLGIDKKYIYIDQQSGKDFNHPNYQKLKKKLKKDDLLIIKSIDRLGRNYEMIIEEWACITKIIKANIFVIDFPLLDTRSETNLIGKFVSDIFLQVLSFVAENERQNIKQRQMEGIRIAKLKGTHMGRPKIILPDNFIDAVNEISKNNQSYKVGAKLTGMKDGTFYKYMKIYLANN